MNEIMPGSQLKPTYVDRKVSELTLWVDNPRIIKEVDFNRLIEQIKLLGVYKPLLINQDNIILGGNMRFQALSKLGIAEVSCSLVRTDNKAQMMDYALSDNDQIGITDEQKLAEYVALNPSVHSKLFAINSSPMKLLSSVLDELSPDQEDTDLPEDGNVKAISKKGEIYALGKHRLLCGDSTDSSMVSKLMDGKQADMVFTDPPYNVDYEGNDGAKIENDNQSNEDFKDFLLSAFNLLYLNTKQGCPIYICHADSEGLNFRSAMIDSGFLLKQTIIWVKSSMVMGRQDYQWQHEPILYGWKPGSSHKWYGLFNKKTVIEEGLLESKSKEELIEIINDFATTVMRVDKPSTNDLHPTMKPLVLIGKLLKNSSKRGDIVLDTFLGSGSTLIACEGMDRVCYGMELEPKYCDVIRKRYAKLLDPKGWEKSWQTLTAKM
jgi:DNA modification methylase